MLFFFVGKPRNGKSFLAMMKIIKGLRETHRDVVTNMVIDVDVLQQYLDALGPRIDVRSRLRMLTDEQAKHFWLYRVGYDFAVPAGYYDKKSEDRVSYLPLFEDARFRVDGDPSKDMRGTLYVIDEIHTLFPARGWQGTPHHAEFYCSQHAKLGDECIFITHNTKLVDSNFVRLAPEFTYCRNGRLEKRGRFRGTNEFRARTDPQPPVNGTEITLNEEGYKLDLAIAECYDTSAGVGMPGGGSADKGFRVKGFSLNWVWVGVAIVVLGAWGFMEWGLPKLTRSVLLPSKPLVRSKEPAPVVPVNPSPSVVATSTVVTEKPKPNTSALPTNSTLTVKGWVQRGTSLNVVLSDGRVLEEGDRSLQALFRTHAVIDGEKVFMEKPIPRSVPVSLPPAATPTPPPSAPFPAAVPPAEAPVMAHQSGSWRTDADGVQRLIADQKLGEGYAGR